MEGVFTQNLDVSQHGAVRGQYHIVIIEDSRIFVAEVAHVFQEAQSRCEFFGFSLPVGDQTFWDDEQRCFTQPVPVLSTIGDKPTPGLFSPSPCHPRGCRRTCIHGGNAASRSHVFGRDEVRR